MHLALGTRERHPPLIRDLAFNRGYKEVNLVQVSKVNYYRLPWDNIQPSKEVSFLTECMGICCVLKNCTVTVLSKQCVNVVSVYYAISFIKM